MNRTDGTNLIKVKKESEPLEPKSTAMLRISEIVDTLIEENAIYEAVDESKLMDFLSTLAEKSPEKLISLTDEELTQRVRRIIVIEATAGMLQDLTPEEMKDFKKAVRRRKFFK